MKRRELKRKIQDGFSELAPDIFEAVMAAAEEQETVAAKADREGQKPLMQAEGTGLRDKVRKIFRFGGTVSGRFPRYAVSVCACLTLLGLFMYVGRDSGRDSVYMVLDINPSIQIEMDASCQVEQIKGINQDGKDVVKELEWEKNEPVRELLGVLIQDVVKKSYLKEDGGVLVTLSTSDNNIGDQLEHVAEEEIERKLKELKVSGVTVACQKTREFSGEEGRKLLEKELIKACGMTKEKVRGMSVMELIRSCQSNTSLELKVSEISSGNENENQPLKKEAEEQSALGDEKESEAEKADAKQENATEQEEDGTETETETEKELPPLNAGAGNGDTPPAKDVSNQNGNTNGSANAGENMPLQPKPVVPQDNTAQPEPADGAAQDDPGQKDEDEEKKDKKKDKEKKKKDKKKKDKKKKGKDKKKKDKKKKGEDKQDKNSTKREENNGQSGGKGNSENAKEQGNQKQNSENGNDKKDGQIKGGRKEKTQGNIENEKEKSAERDE